MQSPLPSHRHRFWQKPLAWLAAAPIADPVDRRNAPMLQILLCLLAALPALAWGYRIFFSPVPWRPGETLSLLLSLALSALAAFSFALIRLGRFQWAVRQMLVVVALVFMLCGQRVYRQPI